MKSLKKPLLLALVLLAAVSSGYGVFAGGLQAPLPLAASVTVQVVDPPVEVAPTGAAQAPRGTPISYEIQADNVTDLAAAQVTFTYEKTLFSFVEVALGSEFDGCLNVFNPNVDGEVQLGLVCQTGHTGGPLTLWTVTLEPKLISPELEQTVNSQFGVTNVTLGNLAEQDIGAQGGSLNIATTFVCGDVHPQGGGDDDVDVLDALLTLKMAVGLVVPDARETVAGDIDTNNTPDPDGDLDIDVLDALRVLKNSVGLGEDLASCGGPVSAKLSGTINVGQKELGPYVGNPKLIGNPQIFLNSAIPITETLGMYNFDNGQVGPMLAKSWDVSADGQVWTFHIRDDVEFHKGFGQMTVEDVVFSFGQVADSTKHARSANVKEIFFAANGSQTTPDDFTWVVDTGVPFSEIPIFELMGTPRAVAAWVVSKKQWDQQGENEANFNTAATGPWEIEEAITGQFWRMKAVVNHWRKTPAFAELLFWEIPDESARVAAFKTGALDTFDMGLGSVSEVEATSGVLLMRVANAAQAGLNFYGQTYVPARDGGGVPWPNYNPDLPWVSPNSDVNSAEWAIARKVRLAMSIAIDRQAIIDNVLSGFGHQLTLKDWMGHEDRLPSPQETWPYDPERAKSLLVEAGFPDGFPDGFSVTLTTAIRGAPAEVEACEAVGQFWEAIGITVNFQNIPYATLRPTLVDRTYEGMTCHSVGSRLAPVQGMASFLNSATFSWGSEHPFLEEKIPAAQQAVFTAVREGFEDEIAQFNIDNVFAQTGLYVVDNVWPVGPKLADWSSFIKQGDIRLINGFEYMQRR